MRQRVLEMRRTLLHMTLLECGRSAAEPRHALKERSRGRKRQGSDRVSKGLPRKGGRGEAKKCPLE
eukprot:3516514-Pleurochrysis_carterae.AAC.1